MQEPHIEGVATHDDPESCAVARKGGSEALTGARAGWAIEPRNPAVRGADAVFEGGRRHRWQRYRELLVSPARSKNLCMRGTSMRENREIPRSPAAVIGRRAAQGRHESHASRRTSVGSRTAP